ncbi:SPOR domain-containing protein [Halomonas sp. HAL1]|uniref:SPOR domain-containing protein n=1 Tax=Halomonas sp. HAL1 TaxID=550984 RepID=UPI00022D3169|nr:SPOR domain-containing protein [Halomonas sp. HAL1]EHA17374.1 acetyl-CoA carboxylase subunit beta [Halomonas sp. HAL1]WKV91401.1 SPOR domain-containing protein [Halomonas sp. HAL1]
MKYGKTERISGIVILLALLAIFVPWLMSDPAPREERPQPSFVIEQPVEVERRNVPAPERPSTIDEPALSSAPSDDSDDGSIPIDANPRAPQTDQIAASNQSPSSAEAAGSSEPDEAASTPDSDPIADLIATNSGNGQSSSGSESQSASSPSSSAQGEWAVQVGSFGEPANAQRLSAQLSEEGFSVYQRERDNNMTTVFVGPYATSEDGESAMSSIKERANVQGLLVRVRD